MCSLQYLCAEGTLLMNIVLCSNSKLCFATFEKNAIAVEQFSRGLSARKQPETHCHWHHLHKIPQGNFFISNRNEKEIRGKKFSIIVY